MSKNQKIEKAQEPEVEILEPEGQEPGECIDEASLDMPESYSSEFESSSKELVRWDPLQKYLAEVRQFPTLSREEEHSLAVRYYRTGDKAAAYKLVMSNLRLVVMIAREYQRHYRNILDLVQEGNIGLLEAVKKYDPFRGVRFPSYAVYWIRAYMLRYLINNIRLVKIGTTQSQRKLFFNLRKERQKLEAEGFVPEAKLLADRLNVKESEVVEMEQRLALPDVSVDAPVGGDDNVADFHSILADSGEDAEEIFVKRQFSEAVRKAVEEYREQLNDKEQAIVDRRLFSEEPDTLQSIAEDFGLSRERIRQLEARLKTRLKEYLSDKLGLDTYGEVKIDNAER